MLDMAALMVQGSFLSAFLQVLFDRITPDNLLKLFHGKKPIIDALDELNTVLISADKLISGAEEKQIIDEEVRKWLHKLVDAVYSADDLVSAIDSEALRRKMEGDGSSMSRAFEMFKVQTGLSSGFDETVHNEATEILRRLNNLLEQKDALGLREGVQKLLPSRRPPAPLVEESSVYGRSGDKEAIIGLLLSGDGSDVKISVIPIVGMGGIGKTTLAQLIYDDDRVEKHFKLRAWVTVSDDFDIHKIMKVIFEQVTSEKCHIEDLAELQRKLREALRGNKFLLVHDDVWNESFTLWESLKSSFESGAYGSKIIVTTRNTDVASLMAPGQTPYQLTVLSPEDGWRLFAKHAFRNNTESQPDQDFQVIGREIVNKCKGLPLAIKSLGASLQSERDLDKWKNILKSEVWSELYRKESSILPALWLSYRHLPMPLKRCFAYCSIFPKDYEFEKDKIILLWMAEGFLQSDKRATRMEERGKQYFDCLLSRLLFQRSSQDGSIIIMHDLIHDLAMFVSGEFCFRKGCSDYSGDFTSKTRHLSYNKDRCDWQKSEGLNAKFLRTFIGLPLLSRARAFVPRDLLLKEGRCLRVLSLHHSRVEELPKSIGNLIHLRYLDLSYCEIKELPNSLCTLYNLQTLLLSGCSFLFALPENMENLISLRHLDIEGVPLAEMSFKIKNMKSLQTLNKVVLGDRNHGPKINELKEVQPFYGRFEISRIETVVNASEASEADMKNKKGVTDLSLAWSHQDNTTADHEIRKKDREILDSLLPQKSLRNLVIKSYRGTLFSEWVGHDSFSNLESIRLESCKNCTSLPLLGQLPSLKKLEIIEVSSVLVIGDEFCGNTPSFTSLESLVLWEMPELKEWSFLGDFPRLSKLSLSRCPKLSIRGSSPRHPTAFPSLVSLDVSCCPLLDSLHELVSSSELKELYISECERLLQCCDLRRLSSLERLDISGWEGDSFPLIGSLPCSLTQVTISNCRNLMALNERAFQELTSLKWVSIADCPKLRCPPPILNLRVIDCPSSEPPEVDLISQGDLCILVLCYK